MKNLRITFLLALVVGGWSMETCWAQQPAEVADSDDARREEQQAIDKILGSERWAQAMEQFDQWLAIQNVYSDAEAKALRSELRNRVASMSSAQLEDFMEEMEARLAVLLSPEATAARQWVAPLTDQAVQRLRAKYGIEDPIRLSAAELETALQQFATDRQAQIAGAAAFNQNRQVAANAAINANQAQQQSLNQAAQRKASSFQSQSTAYAPRPAERNPRTFSKRYPGSSYSIGPWGGVWITPRQ